MPQNINNNINISFNNKQKSVVKSKILKEESNIKRITMNQNTQFNKIIENKKNKFTDL